MKICLAKAGILPFKKGYSGVNSFLKRISAFSLLMFLFAATALSQAKKVTGKVTNSDNSNGLSGVNVTIEGSTIVVATDNTGQYSIEVPSSKSSLVFTYVGFATQKIRVGNGTVINVSLNSDTKELDQVIVVGYGTQKKSDLTGSVSVVSSRDFNKTPVIDAFQALQGKVPGLQIVSNSGMPGDSKDIQIRGLQS